MMRLSDMRPGAKPSAPAPAREPSPPPFEATDDDVRFLREAGKRLGRLMAPRDFRNLMAEAQLDLLMRRATVADVVKRVGVAIAEGEKRMAEAREQIRLVNERWATMFPEETE